MDAPTIKIGPVMDAGDQTDASPMSFGPSVLVTFEHVRYEDRKVLMTRLRKHEGHLKLEVRMLEDKSGLVISTIEQVSLSSFQDHIASTVRAACLTFNRRLVVCSTVAPAARKAVLFR